MTADRLEAVGWHADHAADIAEALDLARAIPAGTKLGPITVRDPLLWRQHLVRDALRGPKGERARTGALLDDVARIRGSPLAITQQQIDTT